MVELSIAADNYIMPAAPESILGIIIYPHLPDYCGLKGLSTAI